MFLKKAHSLKIDDIRMCYLAGLFDGEGYFGFYNSKGHDYAQVQVVNTEMSLLKPFLVFGGNIYKHSHSGNINHAQSFAYTLKGRRIILNFILSVYWFMKSEKKKVRMRKFLRDNIDFLTLRDQRKFAVDLKFGD